MEVCIQLCFKEGDYVDMNNVHSCSTIHTFTCFPERSSEVELYQKNFVMSKAVKGNH